MNFKASKRKGKGKGVHTRWGIWWEEIQVPPQHMSWGRWVCYCSSPPIYMAPPNISYTIRSQEQITSLIYYDNNYLPWTLAGQSIFIRKTDSSTDWYHSSIWGVSPFFCSLWIPFLTSPISVCCFFYPIA